MTNFIEHLIQLAPTGETMLFVSQKPITKTGEQQYHADGTPKYTWPAFLPERFKFTGASYVNTGSLSLIVLPMVSQAQRRLTVIL